MENEAQKSIAALPKVMDLSRRSWTHLKSRMAAMLGVLLITLLLSGLSSLIFIGVFPPMFLSVPFSLMLGSVPSIIILLWGNAATIYAVSSQENTVRKSFSLAWKKILPLVWVLLLTIFVVAGGYSLLVVPGIIVFVWLFFVLFVLINEDESGMAVLAKSREYVRGRWFPVFGRMLFLWLIPFPVIVVLNLAAMGARHSQAASLVLLGILLIFTLLYALYSLAFTSVLYSDLRKTMPLSGEAGDLRKSKKLLLGIGGGGLVAALVLVFAGIVATTSLGDAAYKGKGWLVKIKLANASPEEIQYALLEGVSGGHADIVRTLLDRGADANDNSYGGQTPLMSAARRDVAELLIERGADIQARDGDGKTALMHAASAPEVAELLIQKGADINVANEEGLTALMIAAMRSEAVVELLLEHGAKIDARDKDGNTALLHSIDSMSSYYQGDNGVEIVNALVKAGANVNVHNENYVTPLYLAEGVSGERNREQVVEALIKAGARE